MYDLYECKPILRMPLKVKIKKCICNECPNGMTLVMYCDNYHLLYYHYLDSNSNQTKERLNCDKSKVNNNVIKRQILLDKSKGELRSMAFNSSGSQLMIIVANSDIFIIPIEKLINNGNETLLRDDSILIKNCSLSNPSAIVWWNSLDQFNEMAIVGNDLGEISFINIKTKCETGGTYVHNSITSLDIIEDRSSVSLIILCKNETQYRLILEETRSKTVFNSSADTRYNIPEQYYFPCFITSCEEKETIGPNNCWNYKPSIIDMSNDNDINETNTLINTTIVYQNPFILSISEAMSDTEEFGQIILRLISNNEFNYTFESFLAKYLIPKMSSLPIKNVIFTEQLFFVFTSKSCAIVSREFTESRKLMKLNPVINEFKFKNEEVINCFKFPKLKSHFNDEKSDEVLDNFVIISSHCVYECRQKNSCQQLFDSIVTSNSKPVISEASLLVNAQRFTSMLGLNISALFEKTADSCLQKRQFSSAVRFYQLAKTAQFKRIANFVSFGYFNEVITYIQVLFSSKNYELEERDRMHFANIAVNCLVQQILKNKIKNKENNAINTLKTFLRECLYYDESVVLRLLVEQGIFHLAQYCADLRAQNALLLNYLLKFDFLRAKAFNDSTYETIMKSDYKDLMLNTTKSISYLNCFTSPKITYSLILRKDLISKYLRFVVKLLPTLEMPFLIKIAAIFDPRRSATQLLLNRILTQFKQTYLNYDDIEEQFVRKKDILSFFIFVTLMILRQNGSVNVFDEKYVTIDRFIRDVENSKKNRLVIETVQLSAGLTHSAYIRNGCLYMWGKSQFGCLGLQTDDCTNVSKCVTNPTSVDLFKSVLSISVKAVSCGAHHTLVLTDFGVYAFGSSQMGQLGLGTDVILSRNPIIISELVNKEIIKIECGQYHSLAISLDGTLMTWGWGLHGQCGHGCVENVYIPKIVEYLSGKKIVQAFGGYAHTIALDSNGIVYSFGNGSYGQLGLGSNVKHSIPQTICLLNEPISRITTKYFHSLALSRDKKTLYIWGTNPHSIRIQAHCLRKSRLNLPPEQPVINHVPNQDYLKPKRVDTREIRGQIIKICTGSMHSLILSSEGEMYSFGRGIDGQLGRAKVRELLIPSKIIAMNDVNVVDIAAGSDYSLAIDISGTIWGFGHNSDSQLGPKSSSLPSNCSNIEEKNKKISIKTSRRLITFVAGGKSVELFPIKINILEDIESYCDSLNYSLDINAMKASTRFSVIENLNVLTDENSAFFDHQILASMLAFYKQDLDLNSVLNRFTNFKCLQMAAFVCELQNDFSKAFDFQLQALQITHKDKETQLFVTLYTKIFCIFVVKTVGNIEELSKMFGLFFQFWVQNEFSFESLETLLDNCYKLNIKDSMFGISFFSYLNENQSMKNNFSSCFLLEMVEFTIKTIANKPEKLFTYQTAIEKITSDADNVSFPAEKLWQNILAHFECNRGSVNIENGVEIVPFEEEIILFTCNHYYGFNDFKLKIFPNFERDINEIKGIDKNEIQDLLEFFKDFNKELWDSLCPKCIISDIKAKHF